MAPARKDRRRLALGRWLESDLGLPVERIEPASGDASFRRYFRVFTNGDCRIAMDAPPDRESCAPFRRIAGYLQSMGIASPRILAADEAQGFMLLTDLGDRQYLDELRENPARADGLYEAAIAALLRLQRRGGRYQRQLPPYDATLLGTELALFRDWLCERHLGLQFSHSDLAHWQRCRDWLVDAALAQPRVFVHRDYHSRNLMVGDGDTPGVLDFQDAVEGPYTYDLVSLLKDCYIRWPETQTRKLALHYHRRAQRVLPGLPDETGFLQQFDLMGVQRHLKAAGIFARLNIRDGKAGYLQDVPRTLGYVTALKGRYPPLEFLVELIESRCLPGLVAS